MTLNEMNKIVLNTVDAIKNSYDTKYNDRHYEEFKALTKGIRSKRQLIIMVENFFDLDHCDAKDMVG